jgi:hypothetical protein
MKRWTVALAAISMLAGAAARAQPPSFLAEVDRNQVAPGEVFTYEVTLNIASQQVDGYHPPDFKGLRVVSAPQGPNQAARMQIGGGGTFIENSLSWRYQLTPAPGQKGVIAIGSARAQVDGREMRSNVVNIRIAAAGAAGSAATPPSGAYAAAAGPPSSPAAAPGESAPPPGQPPPLTSAAAGSANFIRVVPDKTRAFVGEQVTVGWYLYLTQRQDKYETITEPRTDAFWTEDVSPVNARTRLSLSQEVVGDRVYQVALLFKKALFPLQPGRLSISPLESEVAQVDFFGSAMRSQRLSAPTTIVEAMPLPKAGQPAGFDPNSVGKFVIEARADRTSVTVGEAVTLTVEVKGQGNLRNLRVPPLPRLDGWKSYEPKVAVKVDPGEQVAGSKTVEYLLLPERAGTTMIPSFELAFFDPATRRYDTVKSEPLRFEIAPDAAGRDRSGVVAGGAVAAGATTSLTTGPIENVISSEIRPIRAHPSMSRDLGATFYRSRFFFGILLLPPLALGLGGLAGRLRERLGQDTQRNRRRRVRQMVRRRLGAAEDHRDAGRASAFYIEIDRVLRDVLAARLRHPVTGLRMDELRDLLLARGMPAGEAARVIAELEGCDRARFAPSAVADSGDPDGPRGRMNAALERAGELIVSIEKAPLREEARA